MTKFNECFLFSVVRMNTVLVLCGHSAKRSAFSVGQRSNDAIKRGL